MLCNTDLSIKISDKKTRKNERENDFLLHVTRIQLRDKRVPKRLTKPTAIAAL